MLHVNYYLSYCNTLIISVGFFPEQGYLVELFDPLLWECVSLNSRKGTIPSLNVVLLKYASDAMHFSDACWIYQNFSVRLSESHTEEYRFCVYLIK